MKFYPIKTRSQNSTNQINAKNKTRKMYKFRDAVHEMSSVISPIKPKVPNELIDVSLDSDDEKHDDQYDEESNIIELTLDSDLKKFILESQESDFCICKCLQNRISSRHLLE